MQGLLRRLREESLFPSLAKLQVHGYGGAPDLSGLAEHVEALIRR